MTVPTVGRVMLFAPSSNSQSSGFMHPREGQPCAAIVAAVSEDGKMVHLSVFDGEGNQHPRLDVPVVQDDEASPTEGYFAYWMPYQVKQHAKNETQAQGQIGGCIGGSYAPPTEEERLRGLRYAALQYATIGAETKDPEEVVAAAEIYFNWLK